MKFSNTPFFAMLCGAIACSFVAHASPPPGDIDSGNFWTEACKEKDGSISKSLCMAYSQGVSEGIVIQAGILGSTPPYCIPQPVTLVQMTNVFAKFPSDRPELRHERGSVLFVKAMIANFPCKG